MYFFLNVSYISTSKQLHVLLMCAGKRRPGTWLNSHAFCSHLVDVMLSRPTGHASRLTGDIMPRWVSFRSVLRCKSGLVPNQELLRVRSGWHGINLKAYSSTIYFAYHTFGYYKIKQTTLVLNKGKSNLNFPDARTRICHAVRWPSPTSRTRLILWAFTGLGCVIWRIRWGAWRWFVCIGRIGFIAWRWLGGVLGNLLMSYAFKGRSQVAFRGYLNRGLGFCRSP